MRSNFILVLLILFYSCAKKPAEEVEEAIDQAQTLLTSRDCQKAIDILEDVGRQNSHAVYLRILASAYACHAGYSVINFIEEDIESIDVTDAASLFPSLSILRNSTETEADSFSYENMRVALNIILHSTGNEPSHLDRVAKFGPRKAGELSMSALLMSFAQLGKFLHYYGNVGATGNKGGGSGTSTCFVKYTDPQATAALGGGATGVCDNIAVDDGHPDLSLAVADLPDTKRRMCEGLMLVTNIIDILDTMTLPDSDSLGDISGVADIVNEFKDTIASNANLATLINTTSQEACEALVDDNTQFGYLQQVYVALFEVGLP